jgi:protocatechuate 3,4-dioxygenase beta subunit
MNRKHFLWKTGAAMLAFTIPIKNNYAFAPQDQPTDACIPTTSDILGPYYRANAPFRSDLTIPGDPGVILNYKGIISDEDCNPLENAVVDVWQANSDAIYDGSSPEFRYRGKFQTGADGHYAFRSVVPGWYLNGPQYRPAHIHFRVTRPGFTELITQLYFEGDPYIANDPWASDPEAMLRIVPVHDVAGEQVAQFDITLKANTNGIRESRLDEGIRLYPNPVRDKLSIEVRDQRLRSIEIFDIRGSLLLFKYKLDAAACSLPMHYLGSAIYFCRVETSKGIFIHKIIKE